MVAVGPRSIPACAGEPLTSSAGLTWKPVYPRVCGGTASATPGMVSGGGLSPRVRGNLCLRTADGAEWRSIPACAGEPRACYGHDTGGGVYPRVCGGTPTPPPSAFETWGLSPRVRGNRPQRAVRPDGCRSIPACAGEPLSPALLDYTEEVYPRVCGGTMGWLLPTELSPGLSPRVRGNRGYRHSPGQHRRSIPACAGEPLGG